MLEDGRSQQQRGSATAGLLGLWVRILPVAWMSVCCVVCCQVKASASGLSLVRRSSTECGVSECDHVSPTMRRAWTTRAVALWYEKKPEDGDQTCPRHLMY